MNSGSTSGTRWPNSATGRTRTAKGERVYAIGDVHGCYVELRNLLERVEAHHLALPPTKKIRVILLGDCIDRGPESERVVRFLRNVGEKTKNLNVLLGNHEQLMLESLAGVARSQQLWFDHGGRQTLDSFGFDLAQLDGVTDANKLGRAMREAITQPVIDWARRRPLWARSGDYLFCHAGVRPGVPIERQERDDLLWIRDDFLSWQGGFSGATIVHGHSIEPEPQFGNSRIGIDTGAYRTGVLSALYLEGDQREIISTRSDV